jgi:hypothetical protein
MFKPGDIVRNTARNVVGEVIEIDGDTVYIEQENGAEVDFPAAQLVLESDFQKRHDRSAAPDAAAQANDAAYAAVIANLYPKIIELGQRHHAAQPRLAGVAPKGWDELSALQKLTAVSAATNVPVKAWLDANQPGARIAIGKLQISVLSKGATRG